MYKKIFLISETISFPFDEGLKKIAYNLIDVMRRMGDLYIATKMENNIRELIIEKVKLNKLFLNIKLILLLKKYSPGIILYIPAASCTFNSFIRAKTLKLMSRKSKVVVLAVQHREYLFLFRALLNLLRPDLLLLLGESDKVFFEEKRMKVKVLPPAVDKGTFHKIAAEAKVILRKKYSIPINKSIVLHVGHLKASRNLECFIDLQRVDNIQVVIVGSTTNNQKEHKLQEILKDHGVIIIDEFIPDIQEVYQLSDIYVFPVLKRDAAIEMPLSILEALACNLPIITTRFGGLSNYFKEDIWFKYFDSTEELIKLVCNMNRDNIQNDKKVEHLTWDLFANEIIAACEELV